MSQKDLKAISQKLDIQDISDITDYQSCITYDEKLFQKAWKMDYYLDSAPYQALVNNDKVFYINPQFIHLAVPTQKGIAQVYRSSSSSSANLELTNVRLTQVNTAGYLCNRHIKAVVPTGDTPAFSKSGIFKYETNDTRFFQTSFFANVSTMYDYFMSLGLYTLWPGKRIDLKYDTSNESPMYQPYSPSRKRAPYIILGHGDGVHLQNLIKDPEPAYHELGHHIVYQSVKTTSGSSKTIHEALADFFVFAKTNNPCLGENICPSEGQICQMQTCLRSAENDMKFTDDDLSDQEHVRSQIFSGMLWDIKSNFSSLDTLALIVLKSVDFLPETASRSDFIDALMKADKALGGSNACLFESAAKERGLTEELRSANVSCSNY